MNSIEFQKIFFEIESVLYAYLPDFEKRQGFLVLISELDSKKLLSKKVIQDLLLIWRFRNKVVSNPDEIIIDDEIAEKITSVRRDLIK